jgi:peptide/nickel transport system permease protein
MATTAGTRLLKDKGAVISLCFILLTILIALFGYFIAPDGSPNADRQIVEIQAKKPGYQQRFLKTPKQKEIKTPGLFQQLFFGKEDDFILVPVTAYTVKSDSFYLKKYIDEGIDEPLVVPVKTASGKNSIVAKTFWLGTDKFGRDILSRIIIGTRISIAVGFISLIISVTLGIFLGAVAGYFGGKTDKIIMWLINVIWSIPTLLLVFGVTLILGKGFFQIFIAVGLTMWVSVARLIRGQVLVLREMEYIQAAKALGIPDFRIIFRHILPNVIGPVLVIGASNFATAMIIESGLSFLGVGIQPPKPSWGLMIKENYNFIITHNPMLALAPGIALMLLVLSFNVLGNGLRDAFDVRGKL